MMINDENIAVVIIIISTTMIIITNLDMLKPA